ncbi:MAG TPA: hypothetical protein VGC89_08425 [Pyrinomonadaceae bacterium]|jgi:hypothetical protein
MIESLTTKLVPVVPPGVIKDNASWTVTEIDTLGFNFLRVVCFFGAMDIAMVALKVQESDTTGSGQADITGGVYGTDGTLPSATDDNGFFAFNIPLHGRKRFITLVATAGDGSAGTYMAAWGELSRAEIVPSSATTRGLVAELNV